MKRVTLVVIALFISFAAVFPCNSVYAEDGVKVSIQNCENIVSERVEQTRWYYRVRDGIKEKRLWSITYGYWKTDWMPA